MQPMDRALQREILEMAASAYPDTYSVQALCAERPTAIAEIAYLAGHDLLKANRRASIGHPATYVAIELTSRGRDFLANDGGLSAVLGVVTVRLHHDTLMWLIENRIAGSKLPPPEKQRLLARLRSLSLDATKHLSLKLVEKGLAQLPDVSQLLEIIETWSGPELLGGGLPPV